MVVAQHLLKGAHVHAVLEHQGCRGMAQLVGGVLCAVQSGGGQMLFHQLVDGCPGDSAAVLKGDEQRVLIHQGEHIPLCDPVGQGAETCLIEIEHPFLVPLAQHPELISPNIGYIQADEL